MGLHEVSQLPDLVFVDSLDSASSTVWFGRVEIQLNDLVAVRTNGADLGEVVIYLHTYTAVFIGTGPGVSTPSRKGVTTTIGL